MREKGHAPAGERPPQGGLGKQSIEAEAHRRDA
jgi:hypothetical protein